MATDFYRLCGPKPVEPNCIIRVGDLYYKVTGLEPLYYEFRNIVGGADLGFATAIYPVAALNPADGWIYYNYAWGINGRIQVQIQYQDGNPRNTVGTATRQRLTNRQANWNRPFQFQFAIVSGDTLSLDIFSPLANTIAGIWFYGWKISFTKLAGEPPMGTQYVTFTDVRRINERPNQLVGGVQ